MYWRFNVPDVSQSLRGQRIRELVYILALTIAIGLLTPVIIDILTEAWNEQGIVYSTVWGIGNGIGNTDSVFIFPVAVYLGLLITFSFDRMKKPQAAVLAFGTFLGGFILYSRGVLIQNVDWIGNIGYLIAGIVFGGFLAGGRKLLRESWPHEFRLAPTLILFILVGVLSLALAELHLLGNSFIEITESGPVMQSTAGGLFDIQILGLIPNLAYCGAYVYIVDQFTKYDYQQSIMVLGPKRGGKTTLMTGAFHEADEMTNSNASADEDLIEYHQDLLSSDNGFGNVDEPTQAGEYFKLGFNYDHGNWIMKNVEVEAIDHGGEVLMDLKDEIDKIENESLWDRRPKPFKRLYEELAVVGGAIRSFRGDSTSTTTTNISTGTDGEFRTEAHEAVARSVTNADSLIITVPLIDFVEDAVSKENLPTYYDANDPEGAKRPGRSRYLAEYDKILDWFTDKTGSDVYVVTTMSDLLLDEFEETKLNGSSADTESEYRRFEHWINTDVLGKEIDRVQEYAVTDDPISVHFEMNPEPYRQNGQAQPNPVLQDGSIHFANGQRLLRQLAS